MEVIMIPNVNILDFEKQHNLKLIVEERNLPISDPARFFATFENSWVPDNKGFLVGVYGNGNTIEESIKEYCKKISTKELRIGNNSIDVPRLFY
ncbi:hypothetical protein M0R19_05785 [Candidatus Pacearchaeota archaeon]|jgi:hypothetical protein|nr:hypothetical protein [Candidatus Pacearchaeota archaeon]